MERIGAKLLPAKRCDAEYIVYPLQLPKKPKRFKLDKTKPKTEAGNKIEVVQPLGTRGNRTLYYRYPAPPTEMTKVEPHQLANVLKAPKKLNPELKLDEAKNSATT